MADSLDTIAHLCAEFLIVLRGTYGLQDRHLVFGEVVGSDYVLREIESYGTLSGKPGASIVIAKASAAEEPVSKDDR